MAMPSRLKRIQCWACGETAHFALELYRGLKAQYGQAATNDMLSRVESFELALDSLEDFPCDEAGIIQAVQEMDKVMARMHESKWDAEIEREVVRWLTRFLIGRTAHDVSILINFVHIPVQPISHDLEQQLKNQRFQPIDFIGLPGSLSWTGLWCRLSVVDTDAKHADKIPEWSGQLENYSAAYFKRFHSQQKVVITGKDQEVVGGHVDAIRFEGDVVWKKDQSGGKGLMEFNCLRQALDLPGAKGIIPELVGYRVDAGEGWIGIKNLTFGLTEPAIVDIKMGTRTWNTDASEKKAKSQGEKARSSTTGTLGVRVVGGKYKHGDEFVKIGTKAGGLGDVNDEQELSEFLAKFLPTETLRTSALAAIGDIQKWWEGQTVFAFYASSLLFAYDTQKLDVCHIRLIDFANVEAIKNKTEDVSGCGTGFETLKRIISSLK